LYGIIVQVTEELLGRQEADDRQILNPEEIQAKDIQG
jgi:hypothetical protein